VFQGDLIITPSWSLVDGEANRSIIWEVLEFNARQLDLLPPDADEPLVYTTLTQLPQPSPE
jgi:hypothetical protein